MFHVIKKQKFVNSCHLHVCPSKCVCIKKKLSFNHSAAEIVFPDCANYAGSKPCDRVE